MKKLAAFCARHITALQTLAWLNLAFTVCLLCSACAVPTWLSDANLIIPLIASSATTILSFLGGITGNAALIAAAAAVQAVATDVENGLSDVESLISEYNSNPSDTLLQDIDQAAKLVSSNLQKILTDTGIPAAIASPIQAWAQLALTQLESWLTLLPSLKVSAMAPGTKLTITVPLDKKAFKAQFNEILSKPTGDPSVDAALAKTKRL